MVPNVGTIPPRREQGRQMVFSELGSRGCGAAFGCHIVVFLDASLQVACVRWPCRCLPLTIVPGLSACAALALLFAWSLRRDCAKLLRFSVSNWMRNRCRDSRLLKISPVRISTRSATICDHDSRQFAPRLFLVSL